MSLLPKKVRSARKTAGFSQRELAKELGVSNKTISAYELGRATPPSQTLAKISKITATPLESFFDKDESWKNLIKIVRQVGVLKRIKRVGWAFKDIKEVESVADHSFRTAVLAMLLAKEFNLDEGKMVKMALIFNLGKMGVGEKRWEEGAKRLSPLKDKWRVERDAIRKLFSASEYSYFLDLWKEWEAQKSREAKILKQIGKLEMIFQALEYQQAGYPSDIFDEFWENAEKYLKGQELEDIFFKLREMREKV